MIVLYAEDDLDDFDFFCEVTKEINPHVRCINTRNGVETIEYLDTAIVLPQLIVLDINMPIMNGKVCLKNIKKDLKLNDIPILIYTTTLNLTDQEQCIQLGALDCIQKPYSMTEAVQKLSKYFQN